MGYVQLVHVYAVLLLGHVLGFFFLERRLFGLFSQVFGVLLFVVGGLALFEHVADYRVGVLLGVHALLLLEFFVVDVDLQVEGVLHLVGFS